MSSKYTDLENFDLVMNFICPKCKGNTSQATTFVEERLNIINFRLCDKCGKKYSIVTTFDNIKKYTIFQDKLIKTINSRNKKTHNVYNEEAKFWAKEVNKLKNSD